MTAPATMKALVAAEGKTASVQDKPVPELGAGEILVEVQAVTLNPTDWKHMRMKSKPGVIMGCDFAGIVARVHPGSEQYASSIGVKVGDRVAGFVHGGTYNDTGSFAEYLKIDAALVVRVPDDVGLPRAASVGIGGYTAAQALFQRLQLSLPSGSELPKLDANSPQVLVWAGSTSVGQYAIQLARAAGYHVIATASPKNHVLLRAMGAAEVYDYREEGLPEKISKEHPNLTAALDCISENGTQSLCVRSLSSSKGGKVAVLLEPEEDAVALRKGEVHIIHTLIYSALGRPFMWGPVEYSQEQVQIDRQFILQFANGQRGLFSSLWQSKMISGNRIKQMDSGSEALQNIVHGLAFLEEGKVSAEKLAYTLS